MFGAILWNLRLARNRKVFEPDVSERDVVLERNHHLLAETRHAIDSLGKLHYQLSKNRPLIRQWTVSLVWKINVDGVRDPSNGRASCRGVIRKLNGVQCGMRMNARRIVVESDNSDVVRILQNNSGHGLYSSLIFSIRNIVQEHGQIVIEHVFRENLAFLIDISPSTAVALGMPAATTGSRT
ncbi:hypothetical protein V6N12_055327 [Hibiscus sabdariffa]|uniref:RNase H type-1 domain-containing protein n=1 Tax=Hibiscus sabdariffa TaxID=183260 RepID=A0ABR1ZV95_9ROSI